MYFTKTHVFFTIYSYSFTLTLYQILIHITEMLNQSSQIDTKYVGEPHKNLNFYQPI